MAPNNNGDSLQPEAPRMSMQTQRPIATIKTTAGSYQATGPSPTAGAPSPLTPSPLAPGASIEQSVRLFKVFEALRNGDTAAIGRAAKGEGEGRLEGTTILHLAIQCAEQPAIEFVLSHQSADVNARDKEGNTPLHVAATLGRVPVVKLLLAQPGIIEGLANYQGKTPLDLARSPEIYQQLQLSRSVFIDSSIRKIQHAVRSSDYQGLEQILGDSRVKSAVDVNGSELANDPSTIETGGTLLHEAARKKDTKLAQILLLNGADPFCRDRKGKLPQDVTKDERTRAVLKRSPAAQAAQQNIQEKTVLGEAAQLGKGASAEGGPGGKDSREMAGYLRKWTNYTSGYKLRWFTLEGGVLSYYKNQDDTGAACRGAINMRIAKLHMDPKDKLLFEIHGKSSVKYSLKANHQVEAKRWFWALNNAIQWAKDEAREEQKREQQQTLAIREARNEQLERQRTRDPDSSTSGKGMLAPSAAFDALSAGGSTPFGGSTLGDNVSYQDNESVRMMTRSNTGGLEADEEDEDYGDDASSHEVQPANKDAFSITAQSAKLQLDLLEQVAGALQSERAKNPDIAISHPTVVQVLASYDTAVGNLKTLLADLLRISHDHESYWQHRLDREQNIRRLWENNMARVVQEQEALESKIGVSEDKRKRTKKALKEALEGNMTPAGDGIRENSQPILELPVAATRSRRPTIAQLTNNELSDDETEDEEEFFDAVDAGEVEVMEQMPPSTLAAKGAEVEEPRQVDGSTSAEHAKAMEIAKSYKGYEDGVRKRLKIDADNRPKVGLWVRSCHVCVPLRLLTLRTGHPQIYDRQRHDPHDASCIL